MSDENERDITPEQLPNLKLGHDDVLAEQQRIADAVADLGDDLDPETVRKITGGVRIMSADTMEKDGAEDSEIPAKPSQLPKSVYELDSPKGKGR